MLKQFTIFLTITITITTVTTITRERERGGREREREREREEGETDRIKREGRTTLITDILSLFFSHLSGNFIKTITKSMFATLSKLRTL